MVTKLNFVIEADIATTQLLEQVLNAATNKNFRYEKFYLSNLPSTFPEPNSLTMFVRCSSPMLRAWVRYLKRIDAPFLYFVDDNFWEIRGDDELALYYQSEQIRKTLDFVVENAEACITNSEVLANYLADKSKRQIFLSPFFDFDKLQRQIITNTFEPDEIRVGFAGSKGRSKDVELIAPVLSDIASKYPNVVFEFIGIAPELNLPVSQIRNFPHFENYDDYLDFQRSRQWDIGLAPLETNLANASKTNNKFREYAALGIPSIYSSGSPYSESVKDKINGMLASNLEEWENKLDNLICDVELRKLISIEAKKEVFEKYSVNRVSAFWSIALSEFTRYPVDKKQLIRWILLPVRDISVLLLRLKSSIATVYLLFRLLGLKGVLVRIWQKLLQFSVLKILAQVFDTIRIGGPELLFKKIFHKSARKIR